MSTPKRLLNIPKRRFFETINATPTVIGADSVIVGNISGDGPFVVSGEVLASDAAGYITGQVIHVNGGMFMG